VILALIATVAFAAKPHRDWKTGRLVESAESRETSGGGPIAIARSTSAQSSNPAIQAAGEYATAAAIAANGPRTVVWQGFVIQGIDYVFMVKRAMIGRKQPNVTINGPIKYAFDKGKFYILDEDGKEFPLLVMKKALLPPAKAPDAKED
jgi:hypothetical protein